jgi:hypothetical protein
VRLRIGEALGQVIRRCGDMLPRYCQRHRFSDRSNPLAYPFRSS